MNLKYLIFGILLLSLGFVYAETMPYWIEDYGNGYNLWVKIPYIPANGDTVVYIEKDSNYKPDGDKVFEFFDDFDGNELDRSKWEIVGEYSMHNGKIKLNPNWVGGYKSGMIETKKLFGKNIIIYSKIDSHTSYIRYGFGEADDNFQRNYRFYKYDDGGPRWWGFRIDGDWYKEGYGYDVDRLEYSQLTIGNDFVELKDNNVRYRVNHELPSVKLPVHFTSWSCSDVTLDYVYVRKYADKEPTTTISKINDNLYKITIHNPNSYPLKDFQVKIPNPSFITSKFEGLKITDKNPQPTQLSDTSSTPTQPAHKKPTLKISTTPEGADIYIDNKYIGKTPITIELEKGKHKIELKKDGYKPNIQDITLNDDMFLNVVLTEDISKYLAIAVVLILGVVIGGYAINKRKDDKKKKEVMDELEDLLKK